MTYSEFSSYLFWYAQISAGLLAILLVVASVRGYRASERKRLKVLQIAAASVIWIAATIFIQLLDAFYIYMNTHTDWTRELEFDKSFRGLIIYQIIWIALSLGLAWFVKRKPKTKLS